MRATSSLLALVTAATLGCGGPERSFRQAERQASVAEAGADVMPFDLEKTTHVFETIESGGLQQVVSDTHDAEQIGRIRGHLSEEAEKFARGDFHDPEMIHGEEMPGLHTLVVGHERISIQYREIDRGAEIRYSTEDPALVAAIHAWFEAQLGDHGDHARAHQ